MQEFMENFRKYIGEKRNYTKVMFKISSSIYRGVKNGRYTDEQVMNFLNNELSSKKEGANNER